MLFQPFTEDMWRLQWVKYSVHKIKKKKPKSAPFFEMEMLINAYSYTYFPKNSVLWVWTVWVCTDWPTSGPVGLKRFPHHSPSSWGNSSHTMAVDVLNPVSTDTVNEAPIARPSMKLCSASLRVIIHATVLMLVICCPRSQWHMTPDTWTSWKSLQN